MANIPRRRFLNNAGMAGLAVTANSWLGRVVRTEADSLTTRVEIAPSRRIAALADCFARSWSISAARSTPVSTSRARNSLTPTDSART